MGLPCDDDALVHEPPMRRRPHFQARSSRAASRLRQIYCPADIWSTDRGRTGFSPAESESLPAVWPSRRHAPAC